MISRRSFIWKSSAVVATCALPGYAAASFKHLRLGVIADLHVKGDRSTDVFEKALRFFDQQCVDGVICAGDLATSGISSELARVAKAWFEVFPKGRRSDGGKVERLFIYGDHDMGGYAWKESRGVLTDDELQRQKLDNAPGEIWQQCFHEKWQPIQVKFVKGVAFVLAHHPPHDKSTDFGNFIPGVEAALNDLAKRVGKRPFFYVQHRPISNPDVFRKFGNCVAITGHTHRNCVDDSMLTQDGFTAINVPCLRYLCLARGRENSGMSPRDGQQGYLMDVTKREIKVRRLDFSYSTGEEVAPPWNALAARSAELAPQFPPDAKIHIGEKRVLFPAALSTKTTPRAYDYELTFAGEKGKAIKRVFSTKCYLPEALDGGLVGCAIPRKEIGEGKFSVSVCPCGCFGAKGKAIEAGTADIAAAAVSLVSANGAFMFRRGESKPWKARAVEKIAMTTAIGVTREKWAENTANLLRRNDFNAIGSGSDWMVAKSGGFLTTEMLAISMWMKDRGDEYRLYQGNRGFCDELPNVFHPEFANVCDIAAKASCEQRKHDEWLIGYFLDNELNWWGDGNWRECGLLDYALTALPSKHTARIAAEKTLRENGGNKELARRRFTEQIAERYFSTVIAAIRRYDPHHLVLGCRFAGIYGAPDVVWQIAGKWCDVITLNCYPRYEAKDGSLYLPVQNGDGAFVRRSLREMLLERFRIANKPLFISEWSFMGADVKNAHEVGVVQMFATQAERAKAVKAFRRFVAEAPFIVGDSFYRWSDEPIVVDGKAKTMNWGLVDFVGKPYTNIVDAAKGE